MISSNPTDSSTVIDVNLDTASTAEDATGFGGVPSEDEINDIVNLARRATAQAEALAGHAADRYQYLHTGVSDDE